MENTGIFTTDYKTLLSNKLRKNYKSAVIGTFIVSLLFTLFYFQITHAQRINGNTLGLFGTSNIEQSAVVQDLKKKVQDNNMVMIATATPEGGLAIVTDTDGEISAISTNQVTLTQEKYTVQPGDSISSIALRAYGDVNAWVRIAEANSLPNPETIEPGVILIIPR